MKVLVTGANGYLGSGIVKYLLERNVEVVATDFKCNNVDKRATIVECNLFDILDPFSFFGRPDVLLHLAWRDGFVHNSSAHIEDFQKHYCFLEKMSASNTSKIVVMGTVHEVGYFEGCVNETTPCNPQSLYGIVKNALRNATELLCKQHNNFFIWLRGYYIVGNPLIGNSVFSKIYKASLNGDVSFPFTSGLNKCDFIDYDTFCMQVGEACIQNEISGIINICSGKPTSLSCAVEAFIKKHSLNIKLVYGAYPDRPYDSKCIYGDSTKIDTIIKKRRN